MNPSRIQQHPAPSARRQRGLSLVEILVALVISLFLVAGVIQLFIGSKQTYRFHDGLSRIQENGRFALDQLARDIRMAGQYGCLPATTAITNVLNAPTAYFWNFGQAIQGFESTEAEIWSPALDETATGIISPFDGGNADIITIRGPAGPAAPILAHGGGANALRVPAGMPTGSTFANCNVVIAASCAAASAFQVTGVATAPATPPIPAGLNLAHDAGDCGGSPPPPPGNAASDLAADFAGGEVARVATKSYYIRTGAGGRPALWLRLGSADPQELVEGVERMEIRYGVCTGAGAARRVNSYVNADAVANWANVCSVRINLLLASLEDNLVTTPQTVIFPADTGIVLDPSQLGNDRRLRQGFSTTVGIRNRLP